MNHSSSVDERPLIPRIFSFILPLMLTGILQLLYNAADSIVVGHFDGQQALAAVSSVTALINLLLNFFLGLSTGASVAIAHDFGAHNGEGVNQTIHTSYLLSLIAGVLVAGIGLVFSRTFLVWMQSPEDVLPLATVYLSIYFLGTPANMLYNFAAASLRSVGDTKRPLLFLSLSGLANVLFNLLFVVVFHMGVAGVAIATVISQYLAAFAILFYQMHLTDCCRFSPLKMRFYPQKLKKIFLIGIPSGIQSCVFSISNVVIQSSINSFGSSLIVAANGACASLEGFTYTAMNSLYHAVLTFVGQLSGARRYDKVNHVVFTCVWLVTVIGLLFGGTTYLFAKPLLSFYLPKDPEAIPYGITRLLYVVVPYFLFGICDVLSGGQRGLGLSMLPMINSILGTCAFRILWIVLFFNPHPDLIILYLCYPVSWVLTSLAHLVSYFVKLHQIKKQMAASG